MTEQTNTIDRIETAANIHVEITVGEGSDRQNFVIPVSEVDLTKEVDIGRVREVGLYPDGYAINSIDIDGSLTFSGHLVRVPDETTTHDLDDLLFRSDGTPRIFEISIVHEATDGATGDDVGEATDTVENCIINSSEYSASAEETTESSYEFMGQRLNPAGNNL
jgi:hypothetical protein